jgi:hypothetical protein
MVAVFKAGALFSVALAVTACAHHSIVVKCDGKLEPINLPEAKAAGMTAAPTPVPPQIK